MRITHVIETLGRGGAEQSVVTLASAQAAHHEVSVITLFRGGPHVDTLKSAGVKVVELDLQGWRWLARDVAKLWRTVRSLRSEVLHAHLTYALVVVGLLPVSRVRRVGTFHNLGIAGGREGGLKARVLRAVLGGVARRRFDVLSAVSYAASQAYLRELRLKQAPVVIPNPVDVAQLRRLAPASREEARRALGLDEATQLIVCLAKFTWEKAHDVLLDAFAEVPGARLVLVGDGPLRRTLEVQAARLGVASRIKWCGELNQTEVVCWLKAASLMVLSSRSEGQPVSLLEAMALEVPIVACSVGGVADMLGGGSFGTLSVPDESTSLGAALRAVLSDPADATNRAGRALDAVEAQYSLALIQDRWAKFYEQSIGR